MIHPARTSRLLWTLLVAFSAVAQHPSVVNEKFTVPVPKPGWDEAEKALKRMSLPAGWKGEVWAAEPDVTHPVGFDVTDDGRVFVAESLRAWRGVPDIRPLQSWLDEDIAARTVDDRLAMMRRHLGEEGLKPYTKNTERIRLLVDSNADGRADSSKVFAEGFSTALDGVASSVLARGNDVWFANIPDIWWLRDRDQDGVADERRSLSHGHGVRISMLGHDLHGLTWGPDGRIYVSVGDRGSHVFHDGRWIGDPESGGVFRFEPDGSGLELYASGLRNPQELVFDEWGNLFTGDNNANSGDEARWVNIVEGASSGWHIGWQWTDNRRFDGGDWRSGPDGPGALAPWITESMWRPRADGQPAYIVPPVGNIGAGPCGAAYYPGTGLSADWNGTFVLTDFQGSSSGSGFWKFKVRPNGASFELTEPSKFIWSVNATDGCWGPDGAFWLLDWTDGWEPEGRGRIYRFTDPAVASDAVVKEVRTILAAGFSKRGHDDLFVLLGHPNFRVRQGAQFELVSRWVHDRRDTNRMMGFAGSIISGIENSAKGGLNLHTRLHGIWAMGQGLRTIRNSILPEEHRLQKTLSALLADPERHIRIQAAHVLGDLRSAAAFEELVKALRDVDARVRAEAAIALGRIGNPDAFPALLELVRANNDSDAVVRHAGVMGLLGCVDGERLIALTADPSPAVRIAAVVALRRLKRNELALFLDDASPKVVLETARAIHDVPVSGAMARLAGMIRNPIEDWALARRVINANLRLGDEEGANGLSRLAARESAPREQRVEALELLARWPAKIGRDRVTGLWRPAAFQRNPDHARAAVRAVTNALFGTGDMAVLAESLRTAAALDLRESAPRIALIATDVARPSSVRLAALKALGEWNSAPLPSVLDTLLEDRDDAVRAEAITLATRNGGAGAVDRLERILKTGTVKDRQAAIDMLGEIKEPRAETLLDGLLGDLNGKRLEPALVVEVLDAAEKHGSDRLRRGLDKYAAQAPKDDPLAGFHWALTGGDFNGGRRVFYQKTEVECIRCHKLYGDGGDVGPDLTAAGKKHDARYFLEAIVTPNAIIATGFETVLVTLKDGETHAGIVKTETADALELKTPAGETVTLSKADIASRDRGLSGMPEGFGTILSRRELRDLVAYLSQLE